MGRLSLKSDEELMLLYQQGEELAFNVLYKRYQGKVYGFIKSRLHNEQATNDVFQATFIKLHKARAQFDSAYPFAPWLFLISRTAIVDWCRKQKREDLLLAKAEQEGITNPQTQPSANSIDLSNLPLGQRSAIEMRFYKDFSFEEMAGALETSPGNARQMVSRGIRKLKLSLTRKGAKDENGFF